jgi:predicted nucleic acid-binding protein
VVLVETSVWIDDIRGAVKLSQLLLLEDIATCPPVLQEVLQGASNQAVRAIAEATLLDAHMLDNPMPLARFQEAARLYHLCRVKGYTIASKYDCLIAASAIAHDVPLLCRDRDFQAIAQVAPLKLFTPARP